MHRIIKISVDDYGYETMASVATRVRGFINYMSEIFGNEDFVNDVKGFDLSVKYYCDCHLLGDVSLARKVYVIGAKYDWVIDFLTWDYEQYSR